MGYEWANTNRDVLGWDKAGSLTVKPSESTKHGCWKKWGQK